MMDKLNIQKVCRTCILEHEHMLKVFSLVNCNGTHLSIAKILSSFSMEDRIEEVGRTRIFGSR